MLIHTQEVFSVGGGGGVVGTLYMYIYSQADMCQWTTVSPH